MRFLVLMWLVVFAGPAFAQPTRVVVEGRVVGPDGKPVAGAAVFGTHEWDNGASTFPGVPVAADGSFTVRTGNAKSPRSTRVFAYAPGFSNASEVKTPSFGAAGYQPVTLVLRPTVDFTVRVIDIRNQPVAAATVEIAKDSFSTQHPLVGIPQRPDAQGNVTFKGLNDKDILTIKVTAPGYLAVVWPSPALAKPLEVQISKGAMLRARILDHDTGAPVAACRMFADSHEGTTDPKGNLHVQTPYGRVHVIPMCDDYGPDYDLGRSGLEIDFTEATANQVHVLRARRNQVLRVRVIDAKGKPIPNIYVQRTFISPTPDDIGILFNGPPMDSEITDDSGEVVFKKSSMDRFTLTADRVPKGRDFRFADVRGTIVLTAPATK